MSMILAIGMATGLTLIQTIGAYLRYLPFEARLSTEERTRLWKYILLWMPVAFLLYVIYFLHVGVDIETYKRVHYVGWIPFVAFSLVVIRNEGMRHLFVAGMQTIWFMLLQTLSGTLILLFLPPAYGTGINRVPVQTAFYILFFLLLLPLENRIYRNLLPPNLFSGGKLAGWSFALLPLGLCASPLITLIERPLMYSWTDRISRFFLLFWGFLLYQYALYAGKRAAEIKNEQHTNELLKQQMQALENNAALIEGRAVDVRRVRHDLRHYNRMLATLLDAGDTEMARKLIEAQDKELLAPPLVSYCKNRILNAALTVYVQTAKNEKIPIFCNVNIDETEDRQGGGDDPATDSDLAILLSNVIENAIIASRKQPEGKRKINVSLVNDAGQYALVVKNLCDTPIKVDGDGLPMTEERGHGTGMISLRNFCKKYDAEAIFEQKDGWVRLCMYWNGQDRNE